MLDLVAPIIIKVNKKLTLKMTGLNTISDSIKYNAISEFYFYNPLR